MQHSNDPGFTAEREAIRASYSDVKVALWAREIMVLPINGRRDDSVRVWSVEGPDGIAVKYEVENAYGGVREYETPTAAFTAAFESASWGVKVIRQFS
jgi:hypothetical protein